MYRVKKHALILGSFVMMWISFSLQNLSLFATFSGILSIAAILNAGTKLSLGKLGCSVKHAITKCADLSDKKSLSVSVATNNIVISFTKPMLKTKVIRAIQDKINSELETQIRSAGYAANPTSLAMRGMAYMILSVLIIGPIAILLGMFVSPIFFLMMITSPILMFYPRIKLKAAILERKNAINDELAFFTMYASVMQTIGKSLYTSILGIVGKKIFPIIETESRMLDRDTRLFGIDPLTALNIHGSTHPNLYFKNLLLGYVSISKSGGDLGQFMEKKSDEFFTYARYRFSNYTKQAEIIGESMLIMLNILPILLLTSSFLMVDESVQMIMSISFVVVPSITMILIIIIDSVQPKTMNVVKFNIISVLLGTITVAIALAAEQPHWLIFGSAVFIGATFNQIVTARQFREISMIESALPDFLRDVTEYRKIGIAIPNALIRIVNQRSYNTYFDSLLYEITMRLKHGDDLNRILESTIIRSWFGKASFFVLGKISESGGGTPEILEQVTNFTGKIKEAKNEMSGGLQIFTYMTYTSPLLMAWSASGMRDVMTKIGPEIHELMSSGIPVVTMTSEFLEIVNLLMIMSSICMGMIMSKLTHFTMKHTLTVGIASIITIISIFVVPFMPTLVR